MLDKVKLWKKNLIYLKQKIKKKIDEMFRSEVNRAISGALQQVSSVWG